MLRARPRQGTKRESVTRRRVTIPAHVQAAVLLEAGYMCANPRCRQIITLELHHICWVKDGGGKTPENLLALCNNCHALHTQGFIPLGAIEVWKAMLVSLNAVDRSGVDYLLYLYRLSETGESYRYTVDTMLLLARLFNAGLIERGGGGHGNFSSGFYTSAFAIKLTEHGKRIVEAWRAGDPTALTAAITVNRKAN